MTCTPDHRGCTRKRVLGIVDGDDTAVGAVLDAATHLASGAGAVLEVLVLQRFNLQEPLPVSAGWHPDPPTVCGQLGEILHQPKGEAALPWIHHVAALRCCGALAVADRASHLPGVVRWLAPAAGDLSRSLGQMLGADEPRWTVVPIEVPTAGT